MVAAAVTCAGLKSLVETVRLQTLNRAGMQQLQLDVHFLRPSLRRYRLFSVSHHHARCNLSVFLGPASGMVFRLVLMSSSLHLNAAAALFCPNHMRIQSGMPSALSMMAGRPGRYATGPQGAGVHHLLDEVVAAAVERSTEPQLLDPALMERILASSR